MDVTVILLPLTSRFHVLRTRTHFRRYRGCRSRFNFLRCRTHFRRYRGRQVPYSCFALLDPFSAVPTTSGPVVFSLRSRTHFRWYRGPRVLFPCFELPDSFSTEPWASGPILMFCALGPVFSGTEVVGHAF
jgi:hypothetical protein